MVHVVSVVCVGDTLHPKLDRRLNRHEEGKEEATVGQHVAEAMHEEEENADQLCRNSTPYKLSQDNLGTPMGQCTMSEEEVCQSVQILHLDVCPGQNVRLFVVLDESDCDISLLDRHLIGLL